MKKLKIMLLSFALLAIIGGTLAFQAKFGPFAYCITTLEEGPDFCRVDDILKTCPIISPAFSHPMGDFYCYTIDNDGIYDCKNINNFLLCTTTTQKLLPD